jgi:hypothetical protein
LSQADGIRSWMKATNYQAGITLDRAGADCEREAKPRVYLHGHKRGGEEIWFGTIDIDVPDQPSPDAARQQLIKDLRRVADELERSGKLG